MGLAAGVQGGLRKRQARMWQAKHWGRISRWSKKHCCYGAATLMVDPLPGTRLCSVTLVCFYTLPLLCFPIGWKHIDTTHSLRSKQTQLLGVFSGSNDNKNTALLMLVWAQFSHTHTPTTTQQPNDPSTLVILHKPNTNTAPTKPLFYTHSLRGLKPN